MSSTFLANRQYRAVHQDRPGAVVRELQSDPYYFELRNRKRPIDLREEAGKREVKQLIRSSADILEKIVEGRWPNDSMHQQSRRELPGL